MFATMARQKCIKDYVYVDSDINVNDMNARVLQTNCSFL